MNYLLISLHLISLGYLLKLYIATKNQVVIHNKFLFTSYYGKDTRVQYDRIRSQEGWATKMNVGNLLPRILSHTTDVQVVGKYSI